MSTRSSVMLEMDNVTSKSSRCSSCPAIVAVLWIVIALARIIYGVVTFKDCPQQVCAFMYLLILALLALFFICTVTMKSESSAAQPPKKPKYSKTGHLCLMGLFLCSAIIAGGTISINQLNNGKISPDAIYCNHKLYTFAFWNTLWEIGLLGFLLRRGCKDF
ncbi:hypothetical protein JOB18_020175 [Solea senegalensis]|nr:uncharacterized protein LOC122766622 isoform X5 [Solea senegalensis]XP_043877572.1 uncharacterized protein LOC122766622 isoform X5 [Solea senegalensis]KAG7496496.1 hypothetical protein JOB18_020175 [Solea senegalensis]KAG7496499.1 hypothetical protein JOB18_020175 [Solea senegalensis]